MSIQPQLDLDAYLARIDYSGPRTATLATLHELHGRHPAAIAFENFDVLLKRPIRLDVSSLETKLVHMGRGGYCYEHNTLFQAALQAFGFSAGSIAARVRWRYPDDVLTPRYHMLLRIHLPEGDYIADVGFGLLTLTAPLRLEADAEQQTPHGLYRLARVRDEFRLDTKTSDGWTAVYQMSLQEQVTADWEVANWYTSTSPDSRFTKMLMAARPVGDRRYGLLNNVLHIHHSDGSMERHVMNTPKELKTLLRSQFNINVPQECEDILAGLVPKA